ncbi:MAG TPA: hypothetical protein VK059_02805, partial [Nocardioidaceae bacterium]|nr:hypothetical protein [Nocardioidaceae bacterium]
VFLAGAAFFVVFLAGAAFFAVVFLAGAAFLPPDDFFARETLSAALSAADFSRVALPDFFCELAMKAPHTDRWVISPTHTKWP